MTRRDGANETGAEANMGSYYSIYDSLRQRYHAALSVGETTLRSLLGSPSSSWRELSTSAGPASSSLALSKSDEGATAASSISSGLEGPVLLHRKKAKGAPDVVRATCHVPVSDAASALESFRAILSASEIRHNWDPVAEKQETLEIVEPNIRLVRTYTRVGWPSR